MDSTIIVKQPVLFISHGGGPCFFMDSEELGRSSFAQMAGLSSKPAKFLSSIPTLLPEVPKAILVISAHWEASEFTVSFQNSGSSLIYDYSGFPKHTYAPYLTYPAETDLNLAERVYNLIKESNIQVRKEMDRGFDHGVFIPLKVAFPEANIPIVQLSVKSNFDFQEHINLGKSLSALRSEGVLIIGSGFMTHNGSGEAFGKPAKYTVEFTEWIHEKLHSLSVQTKTQVVDDFVNIQKLQPNVKRCHPRLEHLIPLYVSLGAVLDSDELSAERIYADILAETVSFDSYLFN